jgi:hypothetical protein
LQVGRIADARLHEYLRRLWRPGRESLPIRRQRFGLLLRGRSSRRLRGGRPAPLASPVRHRAPSGSGGPAWGGHMSGRWTVADRFGPDSRRWPHRRHLPSSPRCCCRRPGYRPSGRRRAERG